MYDSACDSKVRIKWRRSEGNGSWKMKIYSRLEHWSEWLGFSDVRLGAGLCPDLRYCCLCWNLTFFFLPQYCPCHPWLRSVAREHRSHLKHMMPTLFYPVVTCLSGSAYWSCRRLFPPYDGEDSCLSNMGSSLDRNRTTGAPTCSSAFIMAGILPPDNISLSSLQSWFIHILSLSSLHAKYLLIENF